MASPTAPTISATGITAPTFADILAYLQTQYQVIFGQDAVLDPDSQDGQLLAVFAQGLADANAAAIAVYNCFSPVTAQGAGLSSVVKINGLKRLVPSFSTVALTLVGVANTLIRNGVAKDINGNLWALPASVVIGVTGTLIVTATCTVPGAVNAAAGSVNTIQTALSGWQSVANVAPAAPGAPVETDAALRLRQAQSVALPSQSIFSGIVAAIANLPGVTRVRGIENNTAAVNSYGIPANALAFIVEGGNRAAIQGAIFLKITPGIPTFGTISATVTDTDGSTRLIKYSPPTNATISIVLTIKALAGWSVSTEALIAAALVSFLQALPIGANVSYTSLIVPAYLPGNSLGLTFTITSMTVQKNALAPVSADIQLAYNEAAVAAAANITFVVT